MKRLKEKKLFKQKRTWVITGAIVVAALGAGFVVLGVTYQQGVFAANAQQRREVKLATASIFSSKPSSKERLAAIKHLSEVDLQGGCRGEWWNGWQQSVLPALKKAGNECVRDQQRLGMVIAVVRQTQELLQYDSAIAQQLATLSISTTKQNWPQLALKSAQEAQAAIKGIRTPKNGTAVQNAVLGRLDAIIAAWNALNAASVKQDKTAYLNAEGELKQAYANLGAIADASDAGISTSLDLLKEAADKT